MITVKQLSKLAGITPRTLHYYDEIGLLKPSRIGGNGYRYYNEAALLHLQQIMLYRQLGMPLGQIKHIIGSPDFDLLQALEKHKIELGKRILHLDRLMSTVEQTISHIKGIKPMSQKQLFEAFSDEQQAEYEKEALQKYDPAVVTRSTRIYSWRCLVEPHPLLRRSASNAGANTCRISGHPMTNNCWV
jgi:DNA-binding transcriptional MerR regulator